MTQTSKTSWGAKYSAKRITNTCKTPDEAARAYDQYLKTYYPQKYSKFANFCEKCGRFVNPLGLPEYKSECDCTSLSSSSSSTAAGSSGSSGLMESPKKEHMPSARSQVTTPTATVSLNPPAAPSPVGGPIANPAEDSEGNLRASNLSVGSLKFSMLDDNDEFFTESLNDVAKMAAGQFSEETEQPAAAFTSSQKRDSLPMAVISSAVESFTQEDNLDQIISDINRTSSTSLHKRPSFSAEAIASLQASEHVKNDNEHQLEMLGPIEPTSGSSTFVDFSPEELQDLSEYFLSDNDAAAVVQQQMNANSNGNDVSAAAAPIPSGSRHGAYKKIHSLDFSEDGNSQRSMIKEEFAAMMDVDAIANSFLQVNTVPTLPLTSTATTATAFPARIEIQTPFLEKYWRNDRKNIQCFPYCPEHGDYYRVRIENLQHRCKGVCRAAVKAQIVISFAEPLSQSGLLVLARCNSTFSRNETMATHSSLNLTEMKTLQGVSAIGVIDNFVPMEGGGVGVQFDVTFYPDVWKFEFDLPKKRRHVQSGAIADADLDNPGSEFLYFFEIDVFYSLDKMVFQRMGHCESVNFQIGNTRTLLRQRNKMTDGTAMSTPRNDGDSVFGTDELPEKKRVKMLIAGQRDPSVSMTSFSEDLSADGNAMVDKSVKQPLAAGYITGEGISSASKKGLQSKDTVDVDAYFRTNSKDSLFDAETRSSDLPAVNTDIWKDDESAGHDPASDYNPYISPKPKVLPAQTSVTIVPKATTRPAVSSAPEIPSTALSEHYSLPKMFGYALVCVPLSVLFLPVGFVLLLAFLLLPPLAPSVVKTLDALADMELSRANSSRISSDKRMVLNQLHTDAVPSGKKKASVFRYHGNGAVWSRLMYFCGVKLVLSIVALCATLPLALFAVLLFPIRPASKALGQAACGCVLWTREYTRSTAGKSLAAAPYDVQGQLV